MASIDDLFGALADPTRRAIVERLLAAGELTVGEIAQPFDISVPAVSRHLQVLDRAGFIERRVDRQWRWVRIRPDALGTIRSWLVAQRRRWTAALDRLEALAVAQTPKRRNRERDAAAPRAADCRSARERLFALWTDPEQVVRWWWPESTSFRAAISMYGQEANGGPPCRPPMASARP
jgi:DNA-binding transcriptional ArsR family regulator